ncbi:hypothetical protein EDB83DRAFT_2324569 [Lactarius deliciosus]|nr:hypothetical protein EDB83DRAFT_2324569 [Lactarius deliciosus]
MLSLGTNGALIPSLLALLLRPQDGDDGHNDRPGVLTLGNWTIYHPAARTPDLNDDDNMGRGREHSALAPVSCAPLATTTTTRAWRAVCTSTSPSHLCTIICTPYDDFKETKSEPAAAAPTVQSNDNSSGSDEGDSNAPAAAPNPDDNASKGSRIFR